MSGHDRESRRLPRRRGVDRLVTLGLLAALLAVLSGCSGRGGDDEAAMDASGASGAESAPLAGAAVDAGADSAAGGAADSAGQAGTASISSASLLADRKQILRADLVVETATVLTDARRAEAAVTSLGGVVTDEDTRTDPGAGEGASGYTVSSLTMRVEPADLNELLEQLAGLGTLVSQSRGSTDVTDEYVDVQARIISQQASLDRLLSLVTDAADLDDVVALENEVSRRQSDLDALSARLQALDEEVTLATVTLTLTSAADAQQVDVQQAGFLVGLRNGWDAFTGALVAGLTVLGAVLPFVALLLVIGVPAYLIRSRRRSPTPLVRATTPPPAA